MIRKSELERAIREFVKKNGPVSKTGLYYVRFEHKGVDIQAMPTGYCCHVRTSDRKRTIAGFTPKSLGFPGY